VGRRLARFAAIALVVAALAGCTDGGEGRLAAPTTAPASTAAPTGLLDGLKGTAPLADVPPELRDRLEHLAPTIGDDAPAAVRPYDAAVVVALATEEARSDAPGKIALAVPTVTSAGTRCRSYQACHQLSDDLLDLDYDGASGDIDLLADGQSGDATFGVYQFDRRDRLAKVSTESAEVPAPAAPDGRPDPAVGPRADGVLHIAMVFPTTGPAASLAEAARIGIRVAVAEVDDDGGALGRPVRLTNVDAGDGSPAATRTAVAEAVQSGADVVIGGVTAADTAALVEPVTAAGLVLLAPGENGTITSPGIRSGLVFRFRPPVGVQGTVLAAAVADDGVTRATVVYVDDADDRAMDDTFRTGFTTLEGTIVGEVAVAPGEPPKAVVDLATARPTGAYVLIGDDATVGSLLAEMRKRQLGPDQVATYVADINPTLLLAAA
jgi:ABC-type branched-subunit amino acid transport system substrate-binding protein